MSREYAPIFATLAIVQNAGGAYTRDVTISLAITPSFLVKHNLIVGGGVGAKCEASPSARWRDTPDASGKLMSFSVEGQESRALPQSSWHVHRWCWRSVFAVDTLNCRQPSGLNENNYCGMSLLLGGLMHGMKIPQQDFALKMQGRLMREGGRICGALWYMHIYINTVFLWSDTVAAIFLLLVLRGYYSRVVFISLESPRRSMMAG